MTKKAGHIHWTQVRITSGRRCKVKEQRGSEQPVFARLNLCDRARLFEVFAFVFLKSDCLIRRCHDRSFSNQSTFLHIAITMMTVSEEEGSTGKIVNVYLLTFLLLCKEARQEGTANPNTLLLLLIACFDSFLNQ